VARPAAAQPLLRRRRLPSPPASRGDRGHPGRRTAGRALSALALLVAVAALAGCGGSDTAGRSSTSATASADDASATTTAVGAGRANATVVRVVDGDTIVARIDGAQEKVRLIGIDTPETVKPRSPVECFGKEASAHTKELLPPGTPVRLVLDAEARDRYGRLLAYVYRAADGEFVNLALARDGYAGQATFPPNVAHVDEFRAAVAQARAAGRGLWSACRDDDPFAR
jgi:micrococcal nuclease